MCDPLTIAGVALSGASAVANTIGANKAASARDDALAAEHTRQQRYDQEASALNVQSQDRYKDFGAQQDAKATDLGQFFTSQAQPIDAANASAALPTTSSNITIAEETNQRQKARAFTDAQGNALGELRAFGSLMGDVGRAQARDASQIAQIGGFKRGSSSILPYELESAAQEGAGLRTLGDVLGGMGNIATAKGLTKGKPDPWAELREDNIGGTVSKSTVRNASFRLPQLFGGR